METDTKDTLEIVTAGKKVERIPLDQVFPFKHHPFRVLDNDEMEELCESIRENGLLNPITVRNREDGNFEIISGHRRTRACKRLGKEFIEAIVIPIDYDHAAVMVVDFNLQRKEILPSEYAHAYQMKHDALKALNYTGIMERLLEGTNSNSISTVKRYLSLNKLCKELLNLVDSRDIPIAAAYHLSLIRPDLQDLIARVISDNMTPVNLIQAQDLKTAAKLNDTLTYRDILDIILKDGRYEKLLGIKKEAKSGYWGTENRENSENPYHISPAFHTVEKDHQQNQDHNRYNGTGSDFLHAEHEDPSASYREEEFEMKDTFLPYEPEEHTVQVISDKTPALEENTVHKYNPARSEKDIEMEKIDQALEEEKEALLKSFDDYGIENWEEESYDDYESIYASPVSVYEARMMEQNNSVVRSWAENIISNLLEGTKIKDEDRKILDKLLAACASCNYKLKPIESGADDGTDPL